MLSLACGSTETFEDMIASLTWPRTLPPGWSVEWDPTSGNDDNAEWCHIRASSWHLVSSIRTRFISAAIWTLNQFTVFELEVPLCFQTRFVIISVKTLWCKNLWIVVISGPAFVWAIFALPILEVKWFLSGLYPRDCRGLPVEVRVKPNCLCDDGYRT